MPPLVAVAEGPNADGPRRLLTVTKVDQSGKRNEYLRIAQGLFSLRTRLALAQEVTENFSATTQPGGPGGARGSVEKPQALKTHRDLQPSVFRDTRRKHSVLLTVLTWVLPVALLVSMDVGC